jgi:hypothetical protein
MAGNVMPFYSVSVKVVKYSDAELISVTVVWLRFGVRLFASSMRPKSLPSIISLPVARIKIKFNQPKLNPHALQDSFQNNLKIVLVHAQIMNGRATNTSSRGL